MSRNLIFDLDGTLVDSCAVCVEILNAMLADRGSPQRLTHEQSRPYMSVGGIGMVAGLLGEWCGDPAREIAEFRARYAEITTARDSLFDHVADGLEMLRDHGFVLSICSNKPQVLCDKVLVDTGLAPLFTTIVGGRDGVPPKPATDLLDIVLAELDAGAEASLFIGDSELDHAIASAAGMDFAFLTYGYAETGWRPAASDCFDCFGELTAALVERAPRPKVRVASSA